MRNAVEVWKKPDGEVSFYRIAGLTAGVLLLGIVLSQMPDLIRYIRIANM